MAKQKKSNAKTTTERDNWGELPQEITESYGTGVIDQPGLSEDDITTLQDSSSEYSSTSFQIGGEDGDPAAEQESATREGESTSAPNSTK